MPWAAGGFWSCACAASVIWWSASPNLTVVSWNDHAVWVEPIDDDANGEGYVTAHFAHDYAKKEFWVGAPDEAANLQTIPSGITQVSPNQSTIFNASSIPSDLQYVWRIHYNGKTANDGVLPKFPSYLNTTLKPTYEEYIAPFTSGQVSINWGNIPNIYSVSCSILNQCGESNWDVIMVTVEETGSGGDPCDELLMRVYPNPVKSNLINVEMLYPTDNEPPCLEDALYYGESADNLVEIYNLQGNLEYTKHFYKYEFTITGINLLRGNYILSITSSNGKSGQKIIIVE